MGNLVDGLVFDGREAPKPALPSPAVVSGSIQVMMARRSCSRVSQRWRSRTFFWSSAKNDSIAALSPQAPARPIDPVRPLLCSVRMKAADRN